MDVMFAWRKQPQEAGVFGLEYGKNTLTLVAVSKEYDAQNTEEKSVECIGAQKAPVFPYRAALYGNQPVCNENFLESIGDLVSRHRLRKQPCQVVLPCESYQLLLVEKPKVENDELSNALRWQLKDRFVDEMDNLVFQSFPLPEGVGNSSVPMVFVVVIKKDYLSSVIDVLTEAGLELEKIDIAELAVRNIIRYLNVDNRGCGYFWMQNGRGSLQFYKDDCLCFTRQFDIIYDLEGEIDASGLGLELQRSMDYYERQMRQACPEKIFCALDNVSTEVFFEIQQAVPFTMERIDFSTWFSSSGEVQGGIAANKDNQCSLLNALAASLSSAYFGEDV